MCTLCLNPSRTRFCLVVLSRSISAKQLEGFDEAEANEKLQCLDHCLNVHMELNERLTVKKSQRKSKTKELALVVHCNERWSAHRSGSHDLGRPSGPMHICDVTMCVCIYIYILWLFDCKSL